MEDGARRELEDLASHHRRSGTPGDHHPHVLDLAELGACERTHVLRPLPTGLIRGPPDRETADVDDLEAPLLELADLVGLFEPAQDDVEHSLSLSGPVYL